MRKKTHGSPRITDIWAFKSSRSKKRYIVEVEGYEHEFYGLKFYWKGVEKSKNRYSLLTNDYEPRRIIRSCIEIMLDYFRRNEFSSFGFIAAPDLAKDIVDKPVPNGNRRFGFYKKLMLRLFGDNVFLHCADISNKFYLMVNRKQLNSGKITLNKIEQRINETYMGEFTINA
ncbi:MAG: hypothetical protein HDR79_08495 [Bacteroides sp.]|nr:hypothetical protein [Bacteroides sp.]